MVRVWWSHIYRAELKAREWRERVVEERFKPFSKKQFKYEPMLHTKAPFEKYVIVMDAWASVASVCVR